MSKELLVAKDIFGERIPKDTNLTKEMLTAKEELDATCMEIASGKVELSGQFNVIANEPYDVEIPFSPVVEAIAKTAGVNRGDDYKYYAIGARDKTVYTMVNSVVTPAVVSLESLNTLTFSEYVSPEDIIYLNDLLNSKYDALALKMVDQMEALNRLEAKLTFDIVIAAAVSASNTFANSSGDTVIDFENLVEMVRSMAKYGSKLVLISGQDVTTDLVLMNYTENKNAKYSIADAGVSEWFKVENYQYTHSGTQTVLATDKAILVATSDSKNNRSIHFVRRNVVMIDGATQKQRVVVTDGPGLHKGSDRILGYSAVTYENIGIVATNIETCAVYKKAASYS